MRVSFSALCSGAAVAAVLLALAPAHGADAEGDAAAAACAADDALPPEQMLGVCGLVVNSTAALPDRLHAMIVRAGI